MGKLVTGQQILERLEKLLVDTIPKRVEMLGISEPVYCLRIWYFGTDVMPEERTPSLMLPKEAWRKRVLAEKGEKVPHYLWCPDEIDSFRDMAYFAELADAMITQTVCDWYSQMPQRNLPDDNDLIPMQAMVRRVAVKLNRLNWPKYAPVTDDFVVVAADGSRSLASDYEELVASVPSERIELLRSRRLLGRNTWWKLE